MTRAVQSVLPGHATMLFALVPRLRSPLVVSLSLVSLLAITLFACSSDGEAHHGQSLIGTIVIPTNEL